MNGNVDGITKTQQQQNGNKTFYREESLKPQMNGCHFNKKKLT